MAALDPCSVQAWRNRLRSSSTISVEGHAFLIENLRSNYLEGTIGLRESIGVKNIPPVVIEQRPQPGQTGNVTRI